MSVPGNKEQSGASNENKDGGAATNRATDAALCVWFVLCAVAFWGPYAGLSLPFNILTALYAVFFVGLYRNGCASRFAEPGTSPRRKPQKVTASPQGKRRG